MKQKIDSGEKQEEREFNPPSSKNAPIKYIYEWVVDIDGTIPTRRVHFDKPFSLAVAKQIAEEMLPTAERGKFRKAAIGDIGYPGDIGRIETYENYEVIYRLNKQNQVSAVKIYAH
ncbi:MAG TPA: hypothetical protein PKY82_31395 [Pyrinomonadaceae bacterium]|nr:hypothetical protein [Pyrinomonadaceae bacterium]